MTVCLPCHRCVEYCLTLFQNNCTIFLEKTSYGLFYFYFLFKKEQTKFQALQKISIKLHVTRTALSTFPLTVRINLLSWPFFYVILGIQGSLLPCNLLFCYDRPFPLVLPLPRESLYCIFNWANIWYFIVCCWRIMYGWFSGCKLETLIIMITYTIHGTRVHRCTLHSASRTICISRI